MKHGSIHKKQQNQEWVDWGRRGEYTRHRVKPKAAGGNDRAYYKECLNLKKFRPKNG